MTPIEQYCNFHLAQSLSNLVRGRQVRLQGGRIVWDSKRPAHEVITVEVEFHEINTYDFEDVSTIPTYTITLILQGLGPRKTITRCTIDLFDIPFKG